MTKAIDTRRVHLDAVVVISKEDFPKAALKHLQDAQALLKSNRFDGAAYLAGYVVECALKTMIEVERKNVPHIHDLSQLQSRLQALAVVAGSRTGHLYVAITQAINLAEPSWRGLELILDRLGGDRLRDGKPQAECLLVASMLPQSDQSLFQRLVTRFTERARDAFSTHYYAEPDETPDELWTLSDLESDDAPHVPVVLPYEERLATFRDLSEVAEALLVREGPYRDLAGRLRSSFI